MSKQKVDFRDKSSKASDKPRQKSIIEECLYVGNSCSCTTFNGAGCRKKQSNGECLKI